MSHRETIEQLLVSVRALRAEYDRAKDKNRELIAQYRRIAREARELATFGCATATVDKPAQSPLKIGLAPVVVRQRQSE